MGLEADSSFVGSLFIHNFDSVSLYEAVDSTEFNHFKEMCFISVLLFLLSVAVLYFMV